MHGLFLHIVLGLAFGAAFVALARWWGRGLRGEVAILGIGLLVAALIYAGFGIAYGDPAWIGIEAVGVLIFGGFAWLGFRYSPKWLALGWALHTAWDALLHLYAAGAVFTPAWYVALCLGFDLLVAAYVLWRLRAEPAS